MQSCVVFGEGGSPVASQNLPAEVLLGVFVKGMEEPRSDTNQQVANVLSVCGQGA